MENCNCHKTKVRSAEDVRRLVNRLARIEGQIRGLRGMIETDAYCPDLLTQVSATRAALDAFGREVLANHIRTCVTEDIREGKDETVDELLDVLRKMM